MISHYTAIVIIAASAMLTMIIGVQGNHFLKNSTKKYFQLIYLLILVANVAEWCSANVNGIAGSNTIHYISKFAGMVITPFVPLVGIATIYGLKDKKDSVFRQRRTSCFRLYRCLPAAFSA